MAADSSGAAAGDLVRSERSRRSDARILLVAPAGSEVAAQQALDCGADRCRRASDRRSCPAAGAGSGGLLRCALASTGARGRGPHRAAWRRGRHGDDNLRGRARRRAPTCVRARSGTRDGRRRRSRRGPRGGAGRVPADRVRAGRLPGGTRGRSRQRRGMPRASGAGTARAGGSRRRARNCTHPRPRSCERPSRDRRLRRAGRRRDHPGARASESRRDRREQRCPRRPRRAPGFPVALTARSLGASRRRRRDRIAQPACRTGAGTADRADAVRDRQAGLACCARTRARP